MHCVGITVSFKYRYGRAFFLYGGYKNICPHYKSLLYLQLKLFYPTVILYTKPWDEYTKA